MKRKTVAPRNPYVAAAKFRKAGVHAKTEKALRRAARIEVQRECGVMAAQYPFKVSGSGSNPDAPTSGTTKTNRRRFVFAVLLHKSQAARQPAAGFSCQEAVYEGSPSTRMQAVPKDGLANLPHCAGEQNALFACRVAPDWRAATTRRLAPICRKGRFLNTRQGESARGANFYKEESS